ncbi:CoA ester lyase [Notoacmeibacter sp. MSK16QG-6]|uniref:HpcH/HpaI aldolase/citrate lyase family protein n=1 Tax=Notoacmeibacter sp. MSK16QG-6 TaxID=2957982 RepID=UPI0020A04F5A|nr:CoA ester lyase [Notoacmeibacter sp. MSK16QG-6]MCP1199129.1 CoA ester lyase [Notoacmeibacter sp. MSK16QG-6]
MKADSPKPVPPSSATLFVPASNERALKKLVELSPDAVIYDLEDAVSPDRKGDAREMLRDHFRSHRTAPFYRVIRMNPLAGPHGTEDMLAAVACLPDAILLPKVEEPADILALSEALGSISNAAAFRIWAMIETPRGMMNLSVIAELGRAPAARLSALVAGTNDLVAMSGIAPGSERVNLTGFLAQMVMAARAGGISVLDGVFNDIADRDGFEAECRQAAALGFDGKTLIHPAQIETARKAFTPTEEDQRRARRIVDAFADPANAGKAVITVDGQMIEYLHRDAALRLLRRAGQTAPDDRKDL